MGRHNNALFKRQCGEFFPVNSVYVKAVPCMRSKYWLKLQLPKDCAVILQDDILLKAQ